MSKQMHLAKLNINKERIKLLLTLVFIIPIFLLIPLSFAAGSSADPANVKLQIPIFGYNEAQDIAAYIGQIYSVALYIIIPITIVVIIFAGSEWIGAGGDGARIQSAKNRIIFAFIGLSIALGSYLLLSLFGLTTLQTPDVEYIYPIPDIAGDNETPASEACTNSDPRCTQPQKSSRLDSESKELSLIKTAQAANQMTLIQQWRPDTIANIAYPNCGTIKSSGCGIVSLTMVINYLLINSPAARALSGQVSVKDVTNLATQGNYHDCTANPQFRPNDLDVCPDCRGTKGEAFMTGSTILKKYGLKGENLGALNKKSTELLAHLEKGEPIIALLGATADQTALARQQFAAGKRGFDIDCGNRFTCFSHYIVLTSCKNCITDHAAKISVNDPNRLNTDITQEELKKYLKRAYWINAAEVTSTPYCPAPPNSLKFTELKSGNMVKGNAIEIDPKYFEIKTISAKTILGTQNCPTSTKYCGSTDGGCYGNITDVVSKLKPLGIVAAVNGGMFDCENLANLSGQQKQTYIEYGRPVGIYIENGTAIPYKPASNLYFNMSGDKPSISSSGSGTSAVRGVSITSQQKAGGTKNYTLICLTGDDKVKLLIIPDESSTNLGIYKNLAGCANIMSMDSGGSTQYYYSNALDPGPNKEVHQMSGSDSPGRAVANFIVVKPKCSEYLPK